jgi:hypothetical protein
MYIASFQTIQNVSNLTASTEVSSFEVEKLQDPLGAVKWRSTGVTAYVLGQFEEEFTPQFWGSVYTNAQDGDTERLRLADTEAELTSGPSLDIGPVDVWPGTGDLSSWPHVHSRHVISSPVAASWFRIDYDFTGNADGYVQIGSVSVDEYFAPVNGHVTPWQHVPRFSATFANLLADGSEGRGGGQHKNDTSFLLGGLAQAEWAELRTRFRNDNSVLPVLAVLDEDEDIYPMEYMYYGYMETRSMPDRKSHFTSAITIREP